MGPLAGPILFSGRVGIDFVAARPKDRPWAICAIEINLRKTGTTHPYCVLRNLAPGKYDPDAGVLPASRNFTSHPTIWWRKTGHESPKPK
jgi:hypothetical protein